MRPASAARTAVITLCSAGRLDHVDNQLRLVAASAPGTLHVVVWLDAAPPPESLHARATVVRVPPGADGLRLAAGRNRGAALALLLGATVLVFLDADCVPGPALLATYTRAATAHPDALLCGAVTYLPEGFALGGDPEGRALAAATAPHPARPAPEPGTVIAAEPGDYALFWSLSFALTADAWRALPPFHVGYQGYGGEDTDYAFAARALGAPLLWVGGADAYHQYHPTSSPPWQHLDDILRNGRLFAERWGEWPMLGWLRAFESAGAVRLRDGAWERDPGARVSERRNA